MLLLYGTSDSWIYASIAHSLTPVSRTYPAQQQGPCPWVQSIISFHTSQARLGLSALCRADSYISVLSSRTLGDWKEPINKPKKKKKIQQEKKPSICWKCWATSALILLMCPWNFLHVLLCKCQKTMALFLQILGNIFFGCAPYTSSFLTHYVSEQGLKRTCLRNISLTYPEIWVCTRSWGSGEFSRVFPFSLWTLYVTLLTNS